MRSHPAGAISADLGGEHRAKSIPPEPDCFVTDIDPTLVQQVFDIPERERKPNVEHHRQDREPDEVVFEKLIGGIFGGYEPLEYHLKLKHRHQDQPEAPPVLSDL